MRTKASSYIKSSRALLFEVADLGDKKCLKKVSRMSGPASSLPTSVSLDDVEGF